MSDTLKREAAAMALDHVKSGMKLGIGSGSTAEAFCHLLGAKVADGLAIVGVPTSERTAALCRELSVPLSTLEEMPALDLTIDGADELDGDLSLIKGGGGALLREKIVATASEKMFVIADGTKLVDKLGAYPLPIEINKFGSQVTIDAIAAVADKLRLSGALAVRERDGAQFVTDGGHLIVDASFGRIETAGQLAIELNQIPGVVEHGLFIGIADKAFIASAGGIQTLDAPN
ncbi:MAG: ribose-5-phosphate isomerase RpiA [Pseudomonadota bacterium]